MIDLIPVVLVTFKLIVLGTGMFLAIKWHYDQGMKVQAKKTEKRVLLNATVKVATIFMLSLMGLLLFTFLLGKNLGLDLSLP